MLRFCLTSAFFVLLGIACSKGDDYDPCAGKSQGEPCRLCPPDDPDCVETMILKTCRADGQCGSRTASDGGASPPD